jgi:hypothetical protein
MQAKRETKREKARDMGLAAGKDGEKIKTYGGTSGARGSGGSRDGSSSAGTWGGSSSIAGGSADSAGHATAKRPAVDPSLHPSWVAQQQAKVKAQELSNVKFAGTKVTFDD